MLDTRYSILDASAFAEATADKRCSTSSPLRQDFGELSRAAQGRLAGDG
ncbi:MAG: hypothetical protein ABIL62_00265 [Planctomycetota bacterium]